MTVATRFAPSPTGFLHIGGARTAYFNWLFAHHHGGRFLLRIEDTDRKRSTDEAKAAIIDGLTWLGLDWDGAVIYQSACIERHATVAHDLLREGKAYRCYCSPDELAEMRAAARADGRSALYDGRWRERDEGDAPAGVAPVIRVKTPIGGTSRIADAVQGEVTVNDDQLDDFILLRADGTPTYMLSVVVDDHDMAISHVIRGDDHLTNAFRQKTLYEACGWELPIFAHIPLIHGPDGAKLSKRHGALGVEAYREMGYLPEALRNYLLRLGWSHGDDEMIDTEQAIGWFGLEAVGRSPARFDYAKLGNLNGHYIRAANNARLITLIAPYLAELGGADLDEAALARLRAMMDVLKPRATTLIELAEGAAFLVRRRPLPIVPKANKLLDEPARLRLSDLGGSLAELDRDAWNITSIEAVIQGLAATRDVRLKDIAQPLRAALTGADKSPGIFDVLAALGRDESLARIEDAAAQRMILQPAEAERQDPTGRAADACS